MRMNLEDWTSGELRVGTAPDGTFKAHSSVVSLDIIVGMRVLLKLQ